MKKNRYLTINSKTTNNSNHEVWISKNKLSNKKEESINNKKVIDLVPSGNTKEKTYYLNGKLISGEKANQIMQNDIDKIDIKKNKDGKKSSVYIYQKSPVTIDLISGLSNDQIVALTNEDKNKDTKYYLNNKLISNKKAQKIIKNSVEIINVKEDKKGKKRIYLSTEK